MNILMGIALLVVTFDHGVTLGGLVTLIAAVHFFSHKD